MIWFDYENQAWVRDGKYERCGHTRCMVIKEEMEANHVCTIDHGPLCYGTLHAGEAPTAEIIAEYAPVEV